MWFHDASTSIQTLVCELTVITAQGSESGAPQIIESLNGQVNEGLENQEPVDQRIYFTPASPVPGVKGLKFRLGPYNVPGDRVRYEGDDNYQVNADGLWKYASMNREIPKPVESGGIVRVRTSLEYKNGTTVHASTGL
jgi:hypothetical protein